MPQYVEPLDPFKTDYGRLTRRELQQWMAERNRSGVTFDALDSNSIIQNPDGTFDVRRANAIVGPLASNYGSGQYEPGKSTGYPNEMFYLQDPFRDVDPSSLIFPEGSGGSDWDFNYRQRRDDYDNRIYGPLGIA